MFIEVLKSKISHATITQAELHYEGSITIDSDVLKAAGIIPGEKVHVLNESSGHRLETYVIAGNPASGVVCLNGPAARHGYVGDRVIILSYGLLEADEARHLVPKIVYLGPSNKIKKS
ncbi:MAG: aspartate 1-decarboxylase [Candidatus Omnitrophica bacterium]|nr:aspartate 1-decarboxylase [Candidatus Omnitrophota bacterium]MDE2009200.1 aspartate 1-decarboxylase [Candidatus Omnitrophota bacterium]MDE2213721.1 aspartate 1-decarboxylase [Candidatus Omnitrophota bacterium]MDE2230704.1 aspartate 1-decarboxylase [Candidatus Omnitrophota bacterium]